MHSRLTKRFPPGYTSVASVRFAAGAAALAGLLTLTVWAPSSPAHETTNTYSGLPLPERGALAPISSKPCTYDVDDPLQKRFYKVEGWEGPDFERYPGVCERLTFAHPVLVKPGQNDVLVEPVTIGKPLRDGYMTRFRPDLVTLEGGNAEIPPVEEVHLHHGTWLNLSDKYGGTVPFIASGEEKTIGQFPRGYGMPIEAEDDWQILYMVHSAVADPMLAWIIYEIDFVPKADAEEVGMKPAYPVWLDVRPSGYPVFNVQRRFGGSDDRCTWPKQKCADFDPWGREFVGQGEPGNGKGEDFELPARGEKMGAMRSFTGGTLVGLGGHLHPGGIKDDIDLVRNGKKSRIFTSTAEYWGWKDHHKRNAPPTSWDLSMTVTGLPYWGVHVNPGDKLRINATYDTKHQATYENMGIAVGAIVPDGPDGKPQAPGVNPFKVPHVRNFKRCLKLGGGWANIGDPNQGIQGDDPFLCEKGVVTHGSHPPNQNHTGARGRWGDVPVGPKTNDVGIAGFQYLPGDLGRIQAGGSVPQVKLGTNLRFTNFEGAAVYHSITTCRFPCMGPTSASFPISDGQTSVGRGLDLDSGQLGIGLPEITPAKQTLNWTEKISPDAGYHKGEVVTYFCRVHPFMRGAFKVVQ